jgi:hypothetical protein
LVTCCALFSRCAAQERKAALLVARSGQPSWLTKLQLLTNPLQPHPYIKVLRSALPPLPHVCRHAPDTACLCQASVLVALDWLLACPPDEAVFKQRALSAAKGHGESGCCLIAVQTFNLYNAGTHM